MVRLTSQLTSFCNEENSKDPWWIENEAHQPPAMPVDTKTLLKACREGNNVAVQQMLRSKADPNSSNTHGYTALMLAAHDLHVDVCRSLLIANANPNTTLGKTTAMDEAAHVHTDDNRYRIVPPVLGLLREYGGKCYAELQGNGQDYVRTGEGFLFPIGEAPKQKQAQFGAFKDIEVPAGLMWAVVDDFGHGKFMRDLIPAHQYSSTGSEVGCKRTLTHVNPPITEELIDKRGMRYKYRMCAEDGFGGLPISSYRVAVSVEDTGRGRCRVEFSGSAMFEGPESGKDAFETELSSVYARFIDGAEKLCLSSEAAAEESAFPAPLKQGTHAVIFPGQGSEKVGMLDAVKDLEKVKAMLDKAKEILGTDILETCTVGPEAKLQDARVAQPALYIAGMAGLYKLQAEKPDLGTPQSAAGMSVGEYTALLAADVFDFEDGLKLVQARAEVMQTAFESDKYMASVAGLPREKLEEICKTCASDGGVLGFGATEDTLEIATALFQRGFTVSGTPAAIARFEKAAKEAGAKQVQVLSTTGPWHTTAFNGALQKFQPVINEVLPRMRPPACDVYMNSTGHKIEKGGQPWLIAKLLSKQMITCVDWDKCMKGMIEDGATEFYDLGPTGNLKKLMRLIDQAAYAKMETVY